MPWEQRRRPQPLAPEIPAVVTIEEGEVFRVETIDWTGGQIKNDDCADDVKNVDLSQVHYLSGPIAVEGAQPGDLLKVELSNLGCLEGDEWGFTGTFHKDNGGGFLTDHYPQATKGAGTLRRLLLLAPHPGRQVRRADPPRPHRHGAVRRAPEDVERARVGARGGGGCAAAARLGTSAAIRRAAPRTAHRPTDGAPPRAQVRPPEDDVRLLPHAAARPLPNPAGAMLGKIGHCATKAGKDAEWDRVAAEAARTVPGRENGGNCDIKNLSRGCTLYLPVFVPGANLSMGDMHFSQGDGEVSFCGAIEMSGFLDLRMTVIKGGMKLLPVVGPSPLSVNPIFEIGPLEPRYSEYLVFEGISVDEEGKQHFLDATLAYKRAVLNCIKYLATSGTPRSRSTCCSRAARARGASRGSSTCRTRWRPWRSRSPSSTRTCARRRARRSPRSPPA